MFLTKIVEKIKTHVIFNTWGGDYASYEMMWKNIVKPDRQHMTM
jgi:hypothetical protein